MLAKVNHFLVGDFHVGRDGRRYASLGLMLLAVAIGLATYRGDGWLWWPRDISLRPDFISAIAAVAMVGALYMRRVIEWAPSVYSILSILLNFTITAMLVQAILGGGWSFFGLAMPYLIVFAIILTWVGMRPLAPVVWALVVLIGVGNLQAASDAMGIWGYIFIMSAALGVLLQLEPGLKDLGTELRYDLTGDPRLRSAAPPAAAIEQDRA